MVLRLIIHLNVFLEAVNAVVTQRKLAQRKHLLPWTFITTSAIPVKSLSLLNEELPPNVHLLTLAKWNDSDDTYIIRLEHLFEKGEDDELSKDVSIDLQVFIILQLPTNC